MIYKKIDISEAHTYGVTDEAAQEFIDWRQSIRKPLTQRAFERSLKVCLQCNLDFGIKPDTALEITIDKGWTGAVYQYIRAELERRELAGSPSQDLQRLKEEPQDQITRLTDRSWAEH